MTPAVRIDGRPVYASLGNGSEFARIARFRIADAIAELEARLSIPYRWLPEAWSAEEAHTFEGPGILLRTRSGRAVHAVIETSINGVFGCMTLSVPAPKGRRVCLSSDIDPDAARDEAYAPRRIGAREAALRFALANLATLDAAVEGPDLDAVLPGIAAMHSDVGGTKRRIRLASPFTRARVHSNAPAPHLARTYDQTDVLDEERSTPLCAVIDIIQHPLHELIVSVNHVRADPSDDVVAIMRAMASLETIET